MSVSNVERDRTRVATRRFGRSRCASGLLCIALLGSGATIAGATAVVPPLFADADELRFVDVGDGRDASGDLLPLPASDSVEAGDCEGDDGTGDGSVVEHPQRSSPID